MLVLSRKLDEEIVIGGNIKISIVRIMGNTVRIGIQAPRDIHIIRGELEQHSQTSDVSLDSDAGKPSEAGKPSDAGKPSEAEKAKSGRTIKSNVLTNASNQRRVGKNTDEKRATGETHDFETQAFMVEESSEMLESMELKSLRSRDRRAAHTAPPANQSQIVVVVDENGIRHERTNDSAVPNNRPSEPKGSDNVVFEAGVSRNRIVDILNKLNR